MSASVQNTIRPKPLIPTLMLMMMLRCRATENAGKRASIESKRKRKKENLLDMLKFISNFLFKRV